MKKLNLTRSTKIDIILNIMNQSVFIMGIAALSCFIITKEDMITDIIDFIFALIILISLIVLKKVINKREKLSETIH